MITEATKLIIGKRVKSKSLKVVAKPSKGFLVVYTRYLGPIAIYKQQFLFDTKQEALIKYERWSFKKFKAML